MQALSLAQLVEHHFPVSLLMLIVLLCPGLQAAIDLIEPIKQKYSNVSYADLYQMASAVAVEVSSTFWCALQNRVVCTAMQRCKSLQR